MKRHKQEILVSTHEGVRLALLCHVNDESSEIRFLHRKGFYSKYLSTVSNWQIVDWGMNKEDGSLPEMNRITYIPGSRQICDGCCNWMPEEDNRKLSRGKRYSYCKIKKQETFEYDFCDQYAPLPQYKL